ncbi:MAG: hypothetical protein KGJ90_02510 [Patescibacteria group bacterium]|nr:hypothetical protein [Patescibacteria group bacterium]
MKKWVNQWKPQSRKHEMTAQDLIYVVSAAGYEVEFTYHPFRIMLKERKQTKKKTKK